MKKLCIVIPSDGLLFENFMAAVDLGWHPDVVAGAIGHFLDHAEEQDLPTTQKFARAAENEATRTPFIQECAEAVAARRAKGKGKSKSPLNILQISYNVLKRRGFSEKACQALADDIGNRAYLTGYSNAFQGHARVSQDGRALLRFAQDRVRDGYEVELIRCEHKRERFTDLDEQDIFLMDTETQLLTDIAPNITVTHCGMVPEGGAYIKNLEISRPDEGINIVVVPQNRLENKITSDNEVNRAFTGPLADAALEKNLTIFSISAGVFAVGHSARIGGISGVPAPLVNTKIENLGFHWAQNFADPLPEQAP